MARLVKLFLLFCLHGLLFDYEQATCSSPSPSPSPSSPSPDDLLCSHSEKTALLQFKRLFGENPPALITWKDEASSDCCSWEGVTCDELTGHVIWLELGDSQLHGAIPSNSTLFHLSHLQYLDLSYNDFNGSNIFPAFPHLTYLSLSSSNIAGSINWVANLTEIHYLDLSSNKLTGPIPTNISGLQWLRSLYMQNNLLSGTLPPDLFDFPMLDTMDLSFNQLWGVIPTTKWAQNSRLKLVMLNDNQLQGSIPGSIARLPSLFTLVLSNNNLSGTLGPQLFLNFQHLQWLDLSHNSFQGPLPQLPPSAMAYILIVSHNKFEGNIPPSYCDLSQITFLVLSHNNLSGVIPGCITNSIPTLQILDLGMNNFHGPIPDNFSLGNQLLTINLKGNRLEGKLPHSLANCTYLTVLDVGNNRIKDTFPYWLKSLPDLQVLVLRYNKFHGSLIATKTSVAYLGVKKLASFPKLRIFDLAHNEFSGLLPRNYFLSLNTMRNVNRTHTTTLEYMGSNYYYDSIVINWKGVESEVQHILTVLETIDFSGNMFEGEIPNDIGNLIGIQSLNLSGNVLTGHIPSSLANLRLLESLDLSSNQLSGVIPEELTRITTLEVLNLSSNHLTGPIPQGLQFNTFQNDSYSGNLGLCGPPLSKKCSDNGTPHDQPSLAEDDDEGGIFDGFGWKVVLLGYGCGTMFGLGVGFVIFSTGKPKRLVTFVEEELMRITKGIGKRHAQGNRNARRRG